MLIRFLIPDWSDRNEEDNQNHHRTADCHHCGYNGCDQYETWQLMDLLRSPLRKQLWPMRRLLIISMRILRLFMNLMTDDFRKVMDKSEFIRAFKKERSYPYLTPLFINYDRVELNEDGTTGTAYYSQAARLPGMVYEVGLVYEDSNWHIEDFDDFLDGSYLDKFDTVTYD